MGLVSSFESGEPWGMRFWKGCVGEVGAKAAILGQGSCDILFIMNKFDIPHRLISTMGDAHVKPEQFDICELSSACCIKSTEICKPWQENRHVCQNYAYCIKSSSIVLQVLNSASVSLSVSSANLIPSLSWLSLEVHSLILPIIAWKTNKLYVI